MPWFWKQALDWLAPGRNTSPVVIQAFDLETGLLLGRLQTEEADEYWLTEDRQSLLMVYHQSNDSQVTDTTIRCWDMPPRKPLRWAVGVPLMIGVLLLSLRYGWRRWRLQPASNIPITAPEATPS